MNVPDERTGSRLSPESIALVDAYFSRVHGALLVSAASECDETVGDLRLHVLEELEGTEGTAANVTQVLAELGSPEGLAAQCAQAIVDVPAPGADESPRASRLSGTMLGVPYDLRPPTAERVASRWWDPLDRHVFVPRLFGAGWTINFGAVAVVLGLIRPDDEDVPFGQVPKGWLATALILPLVGAGVLGVLIAVFQPGLPAVVPTHYSLVGVPDGFASKGVAAILPVVLAVLSLGLAVWTWARRRAPLLRAATGALALSFVSLSIAIYVQELTTVNGSSGLWALWSGLIAMFVLPLTLFVILSRAGRAAEQRHDLEDHRSKGSM